MTAMKQALFKLALNSVRWLVSLTIVWLPVQAALAIGSGAVQGQRGMVVSCHRLASEAGTHVLAAGGNAVDAAVATAFALAVTCPRAGNLAGGGFALILKPDGTVITNDHREKAPALAYRDMFLNQAGEVVPALSRASHMAAGVPGTVAGLLDMLEEYGQLPRKAVLAPAIRLAAKGFVLNQTLANQFQFFADRFAKNPYTLSLFSKGEGGFYKAGDLFRQPDLAATLRRISRQGKAGFYEGKTADLLVAEMRRGGGLITYTDLRTYRSVWRNPVQGRYRGYDIFSMGLPSSGGILLLQMLNMLESVPVSELGFGSADLAHYMIETERRAFVNRQLADPDFYDSPVEQLISKAFAQQQFATINARRATPSDSITGGPVPVRKESTETTHLSVVDDAGWAVALTTTLNSSYGSKIAVKGTGMLLNNEMDDFAVAPGTANQFGLIGREVNRVEPGKRMLSSMTPTIVMKDGELLLATGSPGGPTIITSVLQVILNIVDHGMPLDRAVQSPRFHHQWQPDRILMEPLMFSPDTLVLLKARGHKSFRVRNSIGESRGIGVTNSIIKQNGIIQGVADPRRHAVAIGL